MDANADTVGDRMERREFMRLLSGTAVLWPFAARAQQADRVRRIAWLGLGRADEPSPYLDSLRAGLSELGWIEGRNLTIGLFWATGREDMEGAARELLASDPEVIVTQELMAIAMRLLQTAKPVVFGFSGDPVDGKLAQSWAKPGGNFTGISYLAIELVGKRIELLKEWLPQTRRIAVLARPQHPGEHLERQATEAVVGKLGIELSYFPYQSQSFLPARDLGELESVFRAVVQDHCDALVVFPDSAMYEVCDRVARFALEAKLPSVSGWSSFAQKGLLMTYGPNVRELYRSLARYTDRILRGTKPADLPIEVPTKFYLAINLKTARGLGLETPPMLLARADEVIE
jgi:putative ABC transport system substrate-binding protein